MEPKRINIIEGSYSMHPLLADYYDFGIFLEIDFEEQKKRIKKRNSKELAQLFFDMWIPMEEKYHKGMRVKERCSLHF